MSNKSVTMTFEIGDLPMLAHAFSIARATAMCCGHKLAQKRLDQYCKSIEALIPEHCRIFDAEEWAEICILIAECSEWSVGVSESGWVNGHYQSGGRIEIKVDKRNWVNDYLSGSREPYRADSPEVVAIREFLSVLAGLESVAG